MNRCEKIYRGPSAAKGGQCLLEACHDGLHETYAILIADSVHGIVQDGSEHFRFDDSECMTEIEIVAWNQQS
jgi:hypothetical protein